MIEPATVPYDGVRRLREDGRLSLRVVDSKRAGRMRGGGTACVLEREAPRALREQLEPDVHQADERMKPTRRRYFYAYPNAEYSLYCTVERVDCRL